MLYISEYLTIVKLIAEILGYLYIWSAPKYLIINSINLIYLSCYLNLNCTRCPILVVEILTSKQPSPATNPAIQLGSGIFPVKMTGLSTGVNSLNSDFKKIR